MKAKHILSIVLFTALLLSGCGQDAPPDVASDAMQERIVHRCGEIAAVYHELYISAEKTEPQDDWHDPALSRESMDAIETHLAEAGIAVMDTDAVYPSYLTAADDLRRFLSCVQKGENAEQEIITVLESGGLSYWLFTHEQECTTFFCAQYSPESPEELLAFEEHTVLDMELTDSGNFYFQIYPADDKHYEDYTLVRTAAPDRELYDLNLRYISPAGYIGTNIFLLDWSEENWNGLSFNDLWDHLYFARCGEQYREETQTGSASAQVHWIPAAQFEEIVLPYFQMDLDTFREMAQYDAEADGYPWRPLETADYLFLWFYNCTPEVTACVAHPDGTITLTVDVLSTDLKTDRLFTHEVTVRPLENGAFQYVGNKVTYQTEYGLPYCEPRLSWE